MAEYVDPAHIDPHPAPAPGGRHRRLADPAELSLAAAAEAHRGRWSPAEDKRPGERGAMADRDVLHPGPIPLSVLGEQRGRDEQSVELAEDGLAPSPLTAVGRAGHVAAVLALICTVALQVAQSIVTAPDSALAGLSDDVSHAVLTVAQLALVVAAAYGMHPGQSR